jgi:hypothetical protein
MITLENDTLVFRFPELHGDAETRIEFQRTLRIPDDDHDYPLPPGLGAFPLRHLDDFAGALPPGWARRGGVIMPMHQSEALWLNFWGAYPCAIRIATGKIDAVTGKRWKPGLDPKRQNYLVVPDQPWLDGYAVQEGVIRQFVAMPLGEGYTAEEQLTDTAEHGGLQIEVFPMKPAIYERVRSERLDTSLQEDTLGEIQFASMAAPDMGLAPGGRMRQEIYEDAYGIEAWESGISSRCFVSIANSLTWAAITGEAPPTEPPSAADYSAAGLPWFDYYGGDRKALKGAKKLRKLKSVKALGDAKGETPLPENESAEPGPVIKLTGDGQAIVREGEF